MDSMGSTVFLLPYAILLFVSGITSHSPNVNIKVSPFIHGIKGSPLYLDVETHFGLEKVQFQGSWYRLEPNPTHLITFNEKTGIPNMDMDIVYRPPMSLTIKRLDEAAEGRYQLEVNINITGRPGLVKFKKTVEITVNVPVSTPVIKKSTESALVEDKDNVTLRCLVETGNKVQFTWKRNNKPLEPNPRYTFSKNNDILFISPVRKEDMGQYRCTAENLINNRTSHSVNLDVFYGPYNLAVNSEQGLRTGAVFTVNPGELVFFDCLADSNPPNTCVWISKTNNGTEIIMTGPRFSVTSYELAQAKEYLCRAFNNVTKKQDETRFTLVVASLGVGQQKHVGEESAVSPVAAVAISSLLIIICMLFVFLRKTCNPKRVIMKIYSRPINEPKKPHRSGHEDATEDFGIYEFVAIPGKMESTQASCRSLARLDSFKDLHTTIYDVIKHVPENPTLSLLKSDIS
ncbi:HEPACAM family member 2 [Chanos chanos]|uniref:HEPACAM family member 2 n=1 Tax=Chanos chanos TaxID=29144 RepID=A0A6J2WFU3_CHACN|nr:HEPACAM family member 2 [Chanos chanos]